MPGEQTKRKPEKRRAGFTLIELLVVLVIIGVLAGFAVPNFLGARGSANELSAKKTLQVLSSAEIQFAIQDSDGDGIRNYTASIGDLSEGLSLRCPKGSGESCEAADALVDESFEGADAGSSDSAVCERPKSGYCVRADFDASSSGQSSDGLYVTGFGWRASPISVGVTGKKDFAIYEDGVLRCETIEYDNNRGAAGSFSADRNSAPCP
ncbi:MAG: type II secretion system protein [Candidatus Dadabacteria bacterium]|nr:type II secretion system protein [Candidatus Dadabacteria bacterium]